MKAALPISMEKIFAIVMIGAGIADLGPRLQNFAGGMLHSSATQDAESMRYFGKIIEQVPVHHLATKGVMQLTLGLRMNIQTAARHNSGRPIRHFVERVSLGNTRRVSE